jgi:hypothetical protein
MRLAVPTSVRCTLVAAVAAATALLGAQPATGGGWWTSIRLDRSTVTVGQEVKAHANVLLSSVEAVEAAQNGREDEAFYVYLLRGFDYSIVARAMRKPSPRNWWSVGDADAFRVGRVAIAGRRSNLALAHASFRVPDLEPGRYAVMFCNAGCVRPLADAIPMAAFSVVSDPGVARLAVRIERLEQRNFAQAQKLLTTRAAARQDRVTGKAKLNQAQARISTLERRLAPPRASVWTELRWFLPGVLIGMLAAALVHGRWAASSPNPRTVARGARPGSSSRGGRSPARPRRSGARSRPRA